MDKQDTLPHETSACPPKVKSQASQHRLPVESAVMTTGTRGLPGTVGHLYPLPPPVVMFPCGEIAVRVIVISCETAYPLLSNSKRIFAFIICDT